MKQQSLFSGTALQCGVAFALLTTISGFAASAGLGGGPALAVPLYLAVAGSVLLLFRRHAGQPRFGAANRVTLARAAMVCALAGFIPVVGDLDQSGRAALSLLAIAALLLDGVDGRIARRSGTATAFGARFDVEVDSLATIVLGLLVLAAGQTGPWVLLIGGMRYLFILAGRAWPALRGDLPPTFRRKAICVASVAALVVSLSPLADPRIAALLCATAGFLLIYSFAIDCVFLLRRARRE